MIYLFISILCSVAISFLFKAFERWDVDKLKAISVNYIVCVIIGLLIDDVHTVFRTDFWKETWFLYAFLLGILFILIFYLIALTTQLSGVSVAASAAKLGVIVPVLFGIFYLREQYNYWIIGAVIVSLISVVLISKKPGDHYRRNWLWLFLPITVLLGSGFIDTALKFLQHYFLDQTPVSYPVTIIFTSAAIVGVLISSVLYRRSFLFMGPTNILGGIALGFPNYFSIYFLLLALDSGELTSIQLFPLNNISIVALATLGSILIFKEKLSRTNIVGIILAILSIYIIFSF